MADTFRCVSIAPFETPVVPPVYWSTARSSRDRSVGGGAGGLPAIRSRKKWTPSSGGTFAYWPVFRSLRGASQLRGKGR